MNNIILILIMLFSLPVFAGEFRILKINKLHLEFDHAVGTNRHWTIPDGEEKKGSFNLRFDLSNYQENIFLRQYLETFYTGQFRYVGYTSEIAAEPYDSGLEFFIKHKSEHSLDNQYEMRYPNQNSIGVRIKFID